MAAAGMLAFGAAAAAAPGCDPAAGAVEPIAGDLVLNEVLWDPPPDPNGDANRDGVTDPLQDEFVEIVNASAFILDLGGVSIADVDGTNAGIRHIFACGTTLHVNQAIVVFGGSSSLPGLGGSQVQTANVPLSCTTEPKSLCLSNSLSEGIVVRGESADPPAGVELISLLFGSFHGVSSGPNASFVRCASSSPTGPPDCDTGATYLAHSTVPGNPLQYFSPGFKVDGSHLTPPIFNDGFESGSTSAWGP
jgi:hypothetical protein